MTDMRMGFYDKTTADHLWLVPENPPSAEGSLACDCRRKRYACISPTGTGKNASAFVFIDRPMQAREGRLAQPLQLIYSR